MKRLSLICIFSLFVGCSPKMPKEREEVIPQQPVKSEGIVKMPEEKPKPLQQLVKSEGIEWFLFEDGLKKAKAENKPLMIHFTADWCTWCKKLEAEAFKNQDIISLSKSFVPVKVDCDKEGEIAKKFQIRGLPTILFTSPDGNLIHQVIGYRATDVFLSEMKTALSK